MSPNEQEEFNSLTSVLASHTNYKNYAIENILNPKRLKFESLTIEDKHFIPWFEVYLDQLKHSIALNDEYFSSLAREMAPAWGVQNESEWCLPKANDLEKIKGLMPQYVREWSDLGAAEREQSMGRILKECELLFPDVNTRPSIEVLVPGAALGRLVVEFVKRGFKTEGNDISYHMLLNSNYILNNTRWENQYVICPFIHKSSNVQKRNDQIRQIYFPDFKPGDVSLLNREYPNIKMDELMSMVAGGFDDLYGPLDLGKVAKTYSCDETSVKFRAHNQNRFSIIATCFFLDTSTNVIDTLKAIKHSLKEDGYWINFGPLLWHFEEDEDTMISQIKYGDEWKQVSVPLRGLELSRDDLLELIKNLGFEFIKHESDIETTYGGPLENSMGKWSYKAEYWVCRKQTAVN